MVITENLLAELLHFVYTIYYRYIYRIVHKIGPSMLVHVYVYEVTTFSINNTSTIVLFFTLYCTTDEHGYSFLNNNIDYFD
jgi:hypothetical protein